MSVREYIGARYVPIFGRMGEDTWQWDNLAPYEPLTVVEHQGNSYISRQYVPVDIEITNTNYWLSTGNFNAQVEAYRREVQTFDGRITANTEGIAHNVEAIQGLDGRLDIVEDMFPVQTGDIADGAIITDKLGAGAVTTQKLADGAVTTPKLADGSVTENKLATDSVGYNQLKNAAITPSKLAGDTIKRFYDKYLSINGTELVVFGDSYTDPTAENSQFGYWPNRLNEALGTTLHNFAIAGAGFGRTAQPISRQQTNCSNTMTSEQANNTSVVVCMAGCNDLLHLEDSEGITPTMINAGILGFINWATSFFPYAEIYVIPFNWGYGKLTSYRNVVITNTFNSIMTYNVARVHIVPYAWTWNLGIASRMYRDYIHPNITGYNHICANILNAISGAGPMGFSTGNRLNLENAPGLNSGYLEYYCRNGVVYVNGYVRPTNAGAQDLTVYAAGNLPAILTPNDSLFVFGLNDSTIHENVGVINFTSNGRLLVNLNANVRANDVCCFSGSFLPEVGLDWSIS